MKTKARNPGDCLQELGSELEQPAMKEAIVVSKPTMYLLDLVD
jgi:hypothetical protein